MAFALVGACARRASQAPLLRCLNNALRLGKVVLQMLHCLVGALLSGAAVVVGVFGPAVVAVIGLHIDASSVGVLRTHAGEDCQFSAGFGRRQNESNLAVPPRRVLSQTHTLRSDPRSA